MLCEFHINYQKKIFFVQLIYKVVLVSGAQQSDSVIHPLFHILFHYGFLSI